MKVYLGNGDVYKLDLESWLEGSILHCASVDFRSVLRKGEIITITDDDRYLLAEVDGFGKSKLFLNFF